MIENKPKILLADDEAGLRELVRVYLENSGFEVHEAEDGLIAEQKISLNHYDLLILDLKMPNLDGLTLCQRIRWSQKNTPIILLTAKGEEIDRLLGFECGADDYVVKPFSPRELTARSKALLRRATPTLTESDQSIHFPNLLLDPILHRVEWHNQSVSLTPKEFSLLHVLAKAPRRVFTREQIMSCAWGENYFAELRIVDVHVKNLREKFNAIQPFDYIQTVRGIGYRFEVAP